MGDTKPEYASLIDAAARSWPGHCHCFCGMHREQGMFCKGEEVTRIVVVIGGIVGPTAVPMCTPCSGWWETSQAHRVGAAEALADQRRMRFFGEPWDAPLAEGQPFEDPPVGMPCEMCGKAISVGDSGVLLSVPVSRPVAVHRFGTTVPVKLTYVAPVPEWQAWHRDCISGVKLWDIPSAPPAATSRPEKVPPPRPLPRLRSAAPEA